MLLLLFFFFLVLNHGQYELLLKTLQKWSFLFHGKNKSIRQPVIVGSLTEAETTDNHHSNVYTHKMSSVWLPVWVQCFSNWGVRVTLHSCCDGKVRNVFVLKCLKKSSWKNFKEDILTEALLLKTHFSPAGSWFKWRQRDTKRDTEKSRQKLWPLIWSLACP